MMTVLCLSHGGQAWAPVLLRVHGLMRKSQRFIYSTGRDIRATVSRLSLGELRVRLIRRRQTDRQLPIKQDWGSGALSPLTAAVLIHTRADRLQRT